MARKEDIPVLDVESRLTDDNHQSLKLWLRMLSCTTLIETEIRSRLRTEFGITLPRFDLWPSSTAIRKACAWANCRSA